MDLVFSSYRSGSTSYCAELAERKKYNNAGEWFHEAHNENWENRYQRLINGMRNNFVVNIMPSQLPHFFLSGSKDTTEIDHLLLLNPTLHFTARKDFDATCRSYSVAERTSSWGRDDVWEGIKIIDHSQILWEEHVEYMKKIVILLSKIYHYTKGLGIESTIKYLNEDGNRYKNREYKFNVFKGTIISAKLDVVRLFESEEFSNQCCKEYTQE